MKLYKLTQNDSIGYDSYSAMLVSAENEEEAKRFHPASYGRNSNKEYQQFYSIAYGSLLELETQFLLSKDCGFLTEEKMKEANLLIEEVSKMLHAMILRLKNLNPKP